MEKNTLIETVERLLKIPKGILAADESNSTCNKRFEKLGVPQTEEKRREYRELLITAPDIEKYISGIILFDETIRQSAQNGKSFTSIMQGKGIDIGIKVDQGLVDMPGHPGEKITGGLEGLSVRLEEYKSIGATFAKWRAVFTIGENTPSNECMKENAMILAKYANLCQERNIVPIIEPEVLIDGDHTIEQCYAAMEKNFKILFEEFRNANVFIPGIILKTSMVISGKDAENRAPTEKVAEMTLKCLKENVPAHIGGIVFLSGGQGDDEAASNLNAMHQNVKLSWPLTFSFSRAIQNKVLQAWAQNPADIAGAQAVFLSDAKNASDASVGKYKK